MFEFGSGPFAVNVFPEIPWKYLNSVIVVMEFLSNDERTVPQVKWVCSICS